MNTLKKWFNWWKTRFYNRSLLGKSVLVLATGMLTCCLCSMSLALLVPSPSDDKAEVVAVVEETEELDASVEDLDEEAVEEISAEVSDLPDRSGDGIDVDDVSDATSESDEAALPASLLSSSANDDPSPTPKSTNTRVPTKTPRATATTKPTATPVPTREPTATTIPTSAPTATTIPTREPTSTVAPTREPTATFVPTATTMPTAEIPTPTAIPTQPPPPTDVPAPTAPPEPTVAPPVVSTGQVIITNVDKSQEYVDIMNQGGEAVSIDGWMLRSEKGNQDCGLGGVLAPGQTLRIWARAEDAGQGGFNCGFGSNIWNNSEPDPAVLFDSSGVEVSRR